MQESRLVFYIYLKIEVTTPAPIQLSAQAGKPHFASIRYARRDDYHKGPFLEAFWDVDEFSDPRDSLSFGDRYIPIRVRVLAKTDRPYHLDPGRPAFLCYLRYLSAE